MKIISNYVMPSTNITSYRQNTVNKPVSDVSFEGDKRKINKNNLIYAPMMLALIGAGACNQQTPKSNLEPTCEYVYGDNISEGELQETSKKYDDVINKFLGQKEINRIEVQEASDPNYKDVFRTIYATGYDLRGHILREVVIHPQEPSLSSKEVLYCPEPEVKLVEYMSDRVVTKEYDNGEYMNTSTRYYGEFELNGISGYKKEIIVSPDGSREFIFKKGEYEIIDGLLYTKDKNFHERHTYYNDQNERTGHIDYRPDKKGIIGIDESTSEIPADF